MKLETVRRLIAQRPFRALRIRMASGEEHRVRHPEQAAVFPDLRVLVIGGMDVGFHILEVELIQEIASTPRNGKSRSGPGARRN